MRRWLLATLAAVAIAAGLTAFQPASPASADMTPQHIVVCKPSAFTPFTGMGKLYGYGEFYCNAKPDAVFRSTTLEYYNPVLGVWYPGARFQTTIPFAGTVIDDAVKACPAGAPSTLWRTRAFIRWTHNNTTEDFRVSSTMRAYCR